jgi:mannose-6-phosphate isomerase-like protein (cupin superfamily)
MATQIFEMDSVIAGMKGNPVEYREFLRVERLNCGLYHLDAGQMDPQPVHDQDEVYHVLSGTARFQSAAGEVPVKTGSVIYVSAGDSHRFVDVSADLTIFVVFAAN